MEHLVVGQGHLPPEVVASEGDQRISRGIFITDRYLLALALILYRYLLRKIKKEIILDLLYYIILHYKHYKLLRFIFANNINT